MTPKKTDKASRARQRPFQAPLDPPRPKDMIPWPDPRDGYMWHLVVAWELFEGRWEPVEVTVKGTYSNPRPITADVLRRIKFGELIAQERRFNKENARWEARDGIAGAAEEAEQWGARRGVTVTDEVLQRVADCYRWAYNNGFWPAETVAERFVISKSAANKRIRMAREKGFLEPKAELS